MAWTAVTSDDEHLYHWVIVEGFDLSYHSRDQRQIVWFHPYGNKNKIL